MNCRTVSCVSGAVDTGGEQTSTSAVRWTQVVSSLPRQLNGSVDDWIPEPPHGNRPPEQTCRPQDAGTSSRQPARPYRQSKAGQTGWCVGQFIPLQGKG